MIAPSPVSRQRRRDTHKENRRDTRNRRVRTSLEFGRSFVFEPLEDRVVMTGTWTSVANNIPGGNGVGTTLLLSDGSLMATDGNNATSKNWYKLTPDSTGSYANGTWTTLAAMHQTRQFYASAVLPDGRVFVAGGEYSDAGSQTNTGEIYDPVANTWTVIAAPPVSNIGDASSEVLPGGNVLVAPVFGGTSYIYYPSSNTWTTAATLLNGDSNSEESWLKLPDGSILNYSIQGSQPQRGQRYLPGTDQWVDAGAVPVALHSNGGNNGIVPEIGPGVLLADGRALYIGASGHTALYTPPATLTGTGSWVAGPDMKNSSSALVGAFDAPAAVEPNGKVLIAAGPIDGVNFPGPTTLLEYDPSTNAMTIVPNSGGPDLSRSPYVFRMLTLPNGQIMVSSAAPGSTGIRLYNPDSAQLSAYAPNITDIKGSSSTTFTLRGTQLNGFSEGAYYGDDAQMASNYPIVSLYDGSGNRYYARTTNWDNVGVATGSTAVTVNFTLPAGLAAGSYGLQVSASGVISNPVVLVVGTTGNDTLIMDTTGGGVSSFILNGNALTSVFGGQGGIYLAMRGGTNTINIRDTYADTPVIVTSAGPDTVNLGSSSSAQGLLGSIRIDNPPNYNIVNIFNSADSTGRTVNIDTYSAYDGQWGSITGLSPGGIYYKYSDTHGINITNGAGSDVTNVLATGSIAPLSIDGYQGSDNVNIGSASGTLSTIQGAVSVGQSSGGSTSLAIQDFNDTSARVIAVTNSSISAPGLPTINYNAGQVSSLFFFAGSGGNTVNVTSTGAGTSTSISPGAGANTVSVQATSGPLAIDNTSQSSTNLDTVLIGSNAPLTGGSLAGIVGPVTVANSSGVTALTVDDGQDATARTYGVTASSISGAGLPTINYTFLSSLSSLTLNGGSGGNVFNVSGTPPNTTLNTGAAADQVNILATNGSLAIQGGNGADTVTIGSVAPAIGGTLSGIGGPISVANTSGTTALIVDDSGDSTARTTVITNNSITGLAAFPISYTNLSSLTVRTGMGGANSTNVQSTAVTTNIIGNAPLAGPDDTALVGVGGSLSGILAALNFSNPPGYTAITVDGSADPATQTVTVTNSSISGMSPALISFASTDTRSVTINSGTGGNTFNVTSSGPSVTINSGAGTDTVNVGDGSNTLDAIFGNVAVVKGAGTVNLNVNDQGSLSGHNYTLSANSFKRGGLGSISFTNVAVINLNGGGGNDTYTLTATPTEIITLNDAAGLNTMAGPNVTSVWTIFFPDSVEIGTLAASLIQSLVGGTANDRFNFNLGASLSGSLDGGLGINTIDESTFTTSITADYSAATITGVGATFANIGALYGGTAVNNLKGPSVDSIFNITGTNAGFITGLTTYNGFANLIGGIGNDTFKFNSAGLLTGSIDGGGGTNTLDYSAFSTQVVVNLAASTASRITLGFSNIQGAAGGTNSGNTLTGPAAATIYTITAANAGNTSSGFSFTGFGNIIAGAANDTVAFGSAGSLTGAINGGGGTNTIDDSAKTVVVLATPSASTITGVGTTYSNFLVLIGSTTNFGVLTGSAAATTFNITGANSGTVGTTSFSKFKSLIGGAANDVFKFSATGSLTGGIDGGGGANSIDQSLVAGPISANLTTKNLTGLGTTFNNVQTLLGGTGANILTGPAAGSTFNITGTNAGNVGGVTFTKYGTLIGGAGNDTFKFTNASLLSGTAKGGGGATNTLDYSGMTTQTSFNMATSLATRLTTAFSAIQNVIGSSFAGNQLTGPTVSTNYFITGANSGNVAGVTFSAFARLIAANGNDIFKFSDGASLSSSIEGGNGTNTLDFSLYTTSIVANFGASTITGIGGTYTNIRQIFAGTASNTLTGPVLASTYNITGTNTGVVGPLTFSKFGTINGNVNNDTFMFGTTAVITNTINGGGGTNTFNYSGIATQVNVNVGLSTASRVTNPFSNVTNFIGGSFAGNQLTGPAAGATFNVTGASTGNVAGKTFAAFGRLIGGAGDDTFVMSNGATLTSGVDGGTGSNWLNYGAYLTNVSVNLATGAATGMGATIANIGKVRGGSGNDTLTGNSLGNVLIGGAGNDNITGGSGRSVLIGGTGIDNVIGGSGDDIVIGGSTTFDSNFSALDSILAEWKSTVDSYATRVNFIKNGGGLNGTNKLILGTTVIDDLAANVLTGNGGTDWFFKGTNDTITDLALGEQVN